MSDGSLFVAIRGTRTDGHRFIPDAVQRGAAAVVVEEGFGGDVEVPVIEVGDTRQTLAELAAAWYGRPAEGLPLVGITGTVGKTSVLTILEAILTTTGKRHGVVGSLGPKVDGELLEETGYTSPDPLVLQRSLAQLAQAGCELIAMEVTSHALVQERVHGLEYGLGIFTSLLPLEHSEYHGSFRSYVDAKKLFFGHLRRAAPLIYNADDRAVRRLAREADVHPVGCGRSRTAHVRAESVETSTAGTRLELNVRRPLPRLDGGEVSPLRLPLSLRLLGRSHVSNATLAATAALCLGAAPDDVAAALTGFSPPPRRMQIVHCGEFVVLDDTAGHPDSISAVCEVAEAFAPGRVHVAFAVRGQRGTKINRQIAQALAVWAERLPLGTLVVTRSTDAADERNRVDPEEYQAFREPLQGRSLPFIERDALDDAVRTVLARAAENDVVLLLGAQGMDDGQNIAREWLESRSPVMHPAIGRRRGSKVENVVDDG